MEVSTLSMFSSIQMHFVYEILQYILCFTVIIINLRVESVVESTAINLNSSIIRLVQSISQFIFHIIFMILPNILNAPA